MADGDTRTDDGSPLLESEDVPASGARPIREEIPYPVEVTSPGNRRWLPRQDVTEDEFGPVVPFRRRPRLRLAVIIIVTVSGLLFAAATAYLFIHLAREAESLSAHPAAQGVAMAGTTPEGGAVPRHGASP
ncbi:MAG: hypothetical protein Q4G40_04670 [Brachybacterium sp.]|nr:hypothetical protein [Brachybacterium sp.]